MANIKKILIISLSNIGDVVLTFPAIDIILNDFPNSQIDIIVGPRAHQLLKDNQRFNKVIVFDKRQSPWQQFIWTLKLAGNKYDMVVDFRHTAIPLFLYGAKRAPVFNRPDKIIHMRDKHLARLANVHSNQNIRYPQAALFITSQAEAFTKRLLSNELHGEPFIILAPGSASEDKRWNEDRFAKLADEIFRTYKMKIVLAGDANDSVIAGRISHKMNSAVVNICGKTDLITFAAVLKHAVLFIGNDSGPTHLASYLNVPTIALFGPQDPCKYGPWGKNGLALRNNTACKKCKEPRQDIKHSCMEAISADNVFLSFRITDNCVLFLDDK